MQKSKTLFLIFHYINNVNYWIRAFTALLRGTFYIIYYHSFHKNIKINFPFKAFTKVTIIGPGRVVIGKNCSLYKNVFVGFTIITYKSDSTVKIGNDCVLGGLTIRCKKKITIGDRCLTAVSTIQDFFFIDNPPFHCSEFEKQYFLPEEISIQENAWIGGHCIILCGATLFKDCVIGAGSVAWRVVIKSYSLGTGNLVRRGFPISRLLTLMGEN